MATPERLVELTVRNQVLLERVKSGFSREFAETINRIDKATRDALLNLDVDKLNQMSKRELDVFIATLRTLSMDLLDGQEADFIDDLKELSVAQAAVEVAALEDLALNVRILTPRDGAAFTFANNLPIRATGTLPKTLIGDWKRSEVKQIEGIIRKGWIDGATIQDMATRVRGTRVASYADGYAKQAVRRSEAVVRTVTQHYSTAAREQTWKANSEVVAGYEWVSVLDTRTTQQCRSLDGEKFNLGEGPRPPIHIGCRSTVVADLGEEFDWLKEDATRSARGPSGKSRPVDADLTYYDWLKKQPRGFQDAAIGPTRGKLLRDGGLTAKKFADLSLGRNFEPLTIAEMKKLAPIAFEKAGLN